ncbi:MAG: response regulator [Candidatus Schekmanbacteria bacterium]|nr:response regulator [Candidatus Schekmanbacteria bacterium]
MCTLNAAMSNLARAISMKEVLINIVSSLRHLFNSDVIQIMEYQPGSKTWSLLEGFCSAAYYQSDFRALTGIIETAQTKLLGGFPLVMDDLEIIYGLPQNNHPRLKSFLALPLLDKNKLIGGVFMAAAHKPNIPQQGCILLLLGNFIGNVIGNAKLFHMVENAKKEWEDTFDSISDMVAIIDKDFNIVRANKTMANKLGKHPREVVGKKCYELMHCQTHPINNCPHAKSLKNRESSSEEIVCFPDGTIHQVTTSPMYNKQREIIGTAHIAHDITEHKKLEQQLLQMQKMESLGTMAGGIAHDFNNLLEGILGYASYIKQQISPNNPIRKELEVIEDSAEKAGKLSKQLLTFARQEKYSPKPVNFNKIVESMVKLFSRTIDKTISVHYNFIDKDMIIDGDAGQLEQALLNICLNARDAMPKGGKIEIETRTVCLDENFTHQHVGLRPGHYMLLSISDTGMGISAKHKDKIFEPFFTTKASGQGTGLGLSMVYGIVKSHKGIINVYSEPNQGTAFKIFLPLSRERLDNMTKQPTVSKNLRGNETILVVDDETNIRKLMGKLLNNYGYKVYMAGDGCEAVDIFRQHSQEIDLIILDMITPRLSGREAYKTIKEIRSGIRVLLSSGYSPDNQMQDVLEDAQGFIQKPYRVEDLLVMVRDVLQNSGR